MIESEIVWPGVYEKIVQNNGNNIEDEEDEGHESDGSQDSSMTEFWLQPIQVEAGLIDQIFNAMVCTSFPPLDVELYYVYCFRNTVKAFIQQIAFLKMKIIWKLKILRMVLMVQTK